MRRTVSPQSTYPWADQLPNRLLLEQLNYDVETEKSLVLLGLQHLNNDQQTSYNIIWNAVLNSSPSIFFLDGYGGTGKTYLYATLCHAVRARGWIVLCVASTGLAALLLPGGRTAHSTFKIPIETLSGTSFCNIPKNSLRAELLRQARLLIWDESLMNHRNGIEALDRTLQDIRNNSSAMGGVTTVLGGDWQQILPVIPKGTREDIVQASLRKSYLWPSITILKLRKNMRLHQQSSNDAYFAQWLLDIGHGVLNDNESKVTILPNLVTFDEEDLLAFVYGNMFTTLAIPPPEYFLLRAIVAPKNEDVKNTNNVILGRMPGDTISCFSVDNVITEPGIDDVENDIPTEYLHSLEPPSLPLAHLEMKLGCPLTLLRNLSPAQGLCNGTRMILNQVMDRVLQVTILGGDHHNETAFIPRISLKPSANLEYPFAWKQHQFPVRLGFAFTINKAEGQSFRVIGIDLRKQVFTHGQLYVALSRATSPDSIKVLLPREATDCKVLNVVYPEVLVD